MVDYTTNNENYDTGKYLQNVNKLNGYWWKADNHK